jgi:hypothetical protein
VVYKVAVLFKESFFRKILGDQVVPMHYLKGASAPHVQAADNRVKLSFRPRRERERERERRKILVIFDEEVKPQAKVNLQLLLMILR